jgi:hypothetical protein
MFVTETFGCEVDVFVPKLPGTSEHTKQPTPQIYTPRPCFDSLGFSRVLPAAAEER